MSETFVNFNCEKNNSKHIAFFTQFTIFICHNFKKCNTWQIIDKLHFIVQNNH